MKKTLVLFMVLAMMVGMVAACGNGDPEPPPPPTETGNEHTWDSNAENVIFVYNEEQLKQYISEVSDISVEKIMIREG